MTIHRKLAGAFALVVLLVGVAGFFGLIASREITKSFEGGEAHFRCIVEAATEASSYAKRAEGHLMLYLTLHDEVDREKFFTRYESLTEQISILDERVALPEGRSILEGLRSDADQILPLGESLIEAHDEEFQSTGGFQIEDHEESVRDFTDAASGVRRSGVELAEFETEFLNRQEAITAATEANSYVKRAEGHLMLYLALHDEVDREKFFTRYESLAEQISILDERATDPEGRSILEELKSDADQVLPLGESLIEAHDEEFQSTGGFQIEDHEELVRAFTDAASGVRSGAVELAQLNIDLETSAKAAATQKADILGGAILAVIVAAIAVALALGYILSRSISKPISKLKQATVRIGKGDLDTKVEIHSKDEIGDLAASFRRMVEDLKKSRGELRLANEELRERNRQLLDARAQAATDTLTGLRNHRAFHERVRDEVSRAQTNDKNLGLIMLDVDSFKRVNDSLGHLGGDQVLRDLAAILADVVKREDAYRYGGDEFAVLLPEGGHRNTASTAERLRRAVERRLDGGDEKVTVSLGVACFPDVAASVEELVYGADAAMYWAKSAGKNRVGDWSKLVKHRADGTLPWYAADRAVKAPDAVGALVAALTAKDPMTAAHTERCSWYTAKLSGELALGEDEASVVRLASLLHDVGKIAVPDEVLFKPGPLNEDEWAEMKKHSTAGLHVLSQVRLIADACPAILHHHEHFDGSGYPHGLAGDAIPLASRILLVTDAFDAMTTDRPYRKAMPVEAAIEELKRNRGSQFDPVIVDAFLRILEREGPQPLLQKGPALAEPVGTAAGRKGNRPEPRPRAVRHYGEG